VNLAKCEFDIERVEFLGFVVSPGGVEMEASRVTAIREWPAPKNSIREVQVFLGFTNFYRRFIYRYSRVAKGLTDLLKTGRNPQYHFIWTDEADKAFKELQIAFTTAPILRYFDPALKIRIETDASGFAVAGTRHTILNSWLSFWHSALGGITWRMPGILLLSRQITTT
jgi:hypothetical protein